MVFADDGEKFGSWPETHQHVYTQRLAPPLLRHARRQSRLARSPRPSPRPLDSTLPIGKVYLPDSSYREMTEWVLPLAPSSSHYQDAVRTSSDPRSGHRLDSVRYVRAGGDLAELQGQVSPRVDEMYARMLGLSDPAGRP